MASRTGLRKSSRDLEQRAANGEVSARLDRWSIQEVEQSLQSMKVEGSDVSLLQWLQRPDMGKADATRDVLERLADQAEDVAMSVALVWRYAKQHEVWKTCTNPQWQTEAAFLDSLAGNQTIRICIQFGTSTDIARRGKINIIRRNWGEGWYELAVERSLLERHPRGAAGLSKRLLAGISSVSSRYSLRQALHIWKELISKRTAPGSHRVVGWKAATTMYLTPPDLAVMSQRPSPAGELLTEMQCQRSRHANLQDEDEILELKSSNGHSSLSLFTADARANPSVHAPHARNSIDVAAMANDTSCNQASASSDDETEDGENSDSGQELENARVAAVLNPRKRKQGTIAEQAAKQAPRSLPMGPRESNEAVSLGLVNNDGWSHFAQANDAADSSGSLRQLRSATMAMLPATNPPRRHHEEREASLRNNDIHTTHSTTTRTSTSQGNFSSDLELESSSLDSLSSMALSSGSFIDAVANGSALKALDWQPVSTSLGGMQDVQYGELCPVCKSECVVCLIPPTYAGPTRDQMFEYAHRAHEIGNSSTDETLRTWTRHITFASLGTNLGDNSGQLQVLSRSESMRSTGDGPMFDKPAIIREDFADLLEWSPARYADSLSSAFAEVTVDVRWQRSPEPEPQDASTMAALCRSAPSSTLLADPPNMLDLPDLTGAVMPSFLRTDRFRLLDLAVEHCKARNKNRAGKQPHLMPFDLGSSRKFNLLGWPGTFSGPHMDTNGATWIRNIFGYKLWFFIPADEMTAEDWAQFATHGDRWWPVDKARAVLLEPGDVLVMRCGLVHAALTLGDTDPCLMLGGSFLDARDLLHTLDNYHWIIEHQNDTNEPIPHQLADILTSLETLVNTDPKRYFKSAEEAAEFKEKMAQLRALGCACVDCVDDCPCYRQDRRCTPLCDKHVYHPDSMPRCMNESREEPMSDEAGSDSDEDFVESD